MKFWSEAVFKLRFIKPKKVVRGESCISVRCCSI